MKQHQKNFLARHGTEEHIDKLVQDPSGDMIRKIYKNPNLNEEQTLKILDHPEAKSIYSENLRRYIAAKHNLPEKVFKRLLNDNIGVSATVLGALGNPKPLSDREVDDAIGARHSAMLADNKLVTSDQIHRALKADDERHTILHWLDHPNLKREHLQHMIASKSAEDRSMMAGSIPHLLTVEDVESFSRDPDERVRANVINNPKITAEQLDRLTNDPSELVRKVARAKRK